MLLILLASLNLFQFALLYLQQKERKSIKREQAREVASYLTMINGLLDRAMYAEGKTWTPPPLTEDEKERARREQEERDEANKRALEGWVQL